MKIATIIIRTLFGLLLLYASISYFLHLTPEQASTGDFKAFQVGIVASTYLMPLAKSIELLCGLAFVSGRFVAPEGMPLALFLFLGNLFLIYVHWDNYKSVFAAK